MSIYKNGQHVIVRRLGDGKDHPAIIKGVYRMDRDGMVSPATQENSPKYLCFFIIEWKAETLKRAFGWDCSVMSGAYIDEDPDWKG